MITEDLSGVKHEEKGLTPANPIRYNNKTYNDSTFVRMHYHSSFEINICWNMKGTINIEGDSVDLSTISLIFIPPNTLHSYRISGNSGNIKVWHLGLNFLPMINSQLVENLFNKECSSTSGNDEETKEIESLLHQIEKSDDFTQSSYILKLLGMFFESGEKRNTIYKYDSFLHKIISYSESTFHKSISLEEAASAVNLSKFHFARKFREKTGSTFMEYINNLRLEYSVICLNRGISVSETAEKSGYEDVSYFIKRFKLVYKQTPLEYQKSR